MSLLNKTWHLYPSQNQLSEKLGQCLNLHPVVGQVLLNRNIRSLVQAKQFLNPESTQVQFELSSLESAYALLMACVNDQTPILVYGDYDVDGMTSTAIMTTVLRALGAKVRYVIPHRFEHGYGLSTALLQEELHKGFGLLLTLDCGISNKTEIAWLNSQGVKTIVVDHHTLPNELPQAELIFTTKTFDSDHALASLCTAGMVFKLAEFIYSKNSVFDLDALLDLAALGTVADVVPLTGENRVIVQKGLHVLASQKREGIRALLSLADFKKPSLNTRDVGFTIAPRLNAAGRMAKAILGVELLLAQTDQDAAQIARTLNQLNADRQMLGQYILNQAVELAAAEDQEAPVLVLACEGWHAGIIGIIASRMVETYGKPVIMIAIDGPVARASARTFSNVNIYSLIKEQAHLLKTFGGHKDAAGFTIETHVIPAFKKALLHSAVASIEPNDLTAVIDIDCSITADHMNLELALQLEQLGPFGPGNPMPLLHSQDMVLLEAKRVGNGQHVKATFKSKQGNKVIDAIGFGMGQHLEKLYQDTLDLVFHLQTNEWNGTIMPQLQLVDFK